VEQLETPTTAQPADLQLASRNPLQQGRPVLICLSYLRWDFAWIASDASWSQRWLHAYMGGSLAEARQLLLEC
jgi:hypothetical protein